MTKNSDFLTMLSLPPLPPNSPDIYSTPLWAREMMQQHLTTKYAVSDPKGIEVLKPVEIGGVDQWLHIRGRNRSNPVLLYIGPPPAQAIGQGFDTRAWEEYFTVVLWDQRQIGKSYYPADDKNEPLSVGQLIDDTEEVAQYLREYLKQDKLFILGADSGGVLGMHLLKRHPDWVHAYIGVGQMVNPLESERMLYQRLLKHARKRGKAELVTKLEAIIPLLDTEFPQRESSYVENYPIVRMQLSHLAGETYMHHLPVSEMGKMITYDRFISPHCTMEDLTNAHMGEVPAQFRSPYVFTREFLGIDLPKDLGSDFEAPVFFFTGVHDWQTPITLSDRWFADIDAPHKELIHFEESSHLVVYDEPGKFLLALVNKVLPFAQVSIAEQASAGQ